VLNADEGCDRSVARWSRVEASTYVQFSSITVHTPLFCASARCLVATISPFCRHFDTVWSTAGPAETHHRPSGSTNRWRRGANVTISADATTDNTSCVISSESCFSTFVTSLELSGKWWRHHTSKKQSRCRRTQCAWDHQRWVAGANTNRTCSERSSHRHWTLDWRTPHVARSPSIPTTNSATNCRCLALTLATSSVVVPSMHFIYMYDLSVLPAPPLMTQTYHQNVNDCGDCAQTALPTRAHTSPQSNSWVSAADQSIRYGFRSAFWDGGDTAD